MTKKLYLFITFILLFASCAYPRNAALTKNKRHLDTSKESIVLFSLKLANNNAPTYQPELFYTHIWEDKLEYQKIYGFYPDGIFKEKKNKYNGYLISCQLPPGKYNLKQIFAKSGIFPVKGDFTLNLNNKFELKPNEIVYLGYISATIRQRMENEMPAGPVFPVIDQLAVGATNGTFVVRITDRFQKDMKLFMKQYPYLRNYRIRKRILE